MSFNNEIRQAAVTAFMWAVEEGAGNVAALDAIVESIAPIIAGEARTGLGLLRRMVMEGGTDMIWTDDRLNVDLHAFAITQEERALLNSFEPAAFQPKEDETGE
jgi:hypothetical protein